MFTIRIHHCVVDRAGPDWVEVILHGVAPISGDDAAVLDRLFPDLQNQVERLLEKQALIRCLEP
jgi:hypothetical protein